MVEESLLSRNSRTNPQSL